jgi:hypothetical protein
MGMKKAGMFAIIGGSAIIAAGAAGIGIAQGTPTADLITADEMTTGQTVTATTAPSAAPIPEAVPDIKGPAPLPVEEQGLPG